MNKLLKTKLCVSAYILSLILTSIFSQNVCAVDNIEFEDLSIRVPYSEPEIRYGRPVWILGVWNYVNITLNDYSNELSLVFYYGDTLIDEDDRDETNFYIWEYKDGIWNDALHDSKYIGKDFCNILDNVYSFNIGIDQWSFTGNWTLRIYSEEGKQIHYQEIFVDNAIIDLALKSYPVEIKIEPFTDDHYTSEENFKIENNGNLPLEISISYGKYSDLFKTLNSEVTGVLKPGSDKRSGIQIHSKSSWQPGELIIEGEIFVIGDATPYIIPAKRVVSLIETTVRYGLQTILHIGRFGYELESLAGDITFQYEKEKDIYYDEIVEIFAYISGNGEINIDIRSENLEIVSIFSGGEEVGTHFSINSKNDTEYPIAISIRGIKPRSTGKIHYDLETGGVHNSFITTVHVGSIRPSKVKTEDATMIIGLAIIICIALVLVYMIYSQIRHKKKNK
jgi:hypothetical protein